MDTSNSPQKAAHLLDDLESIRLLLGEKAAEPTSGGISESFLAANGYLKS